MKSPAYIDSNIISETDVRRSLYPDVEFGSYVCIGSNVRIGIGSTIGHHVVLHEDCVVGENVRIDDGSVLGKLPLRSPNSATTNALLLPPVIVGDGCLIGTHAVIYRGAAVGKRVLIADLATVREQTVIGDLTIIGRGVAVENQVSIGTHCKIETGAYITAKSVIGNHCFVAPEVTFTNDNFVGRSEERFKHFGGVIMEDGARVGANATILPGVVIGADALVAAGSTVSRNVPSCMVVLGAPARVLRPVPPSQLLSVLTPVSNSSGAV